MKAGSMNEPAFSFRRESRPAPLDGGLGDTPPSVTRRQPSYWAVKPPSITNSLPVINEDSSDARNSTP